MVSFNTSQLFHDDSNGCWVPLELAFIASAVVTRMRMRCYGHMTHSTSPLYTSVRSLRDLHSLGPSALGRVNSVETCTSVYNLYISCTQTLFCGEISLVRLESPSLILPLSSDTSHKGLHKVQHGVNSPQSARSRDPQVFSYTFVLAYARTLLNINIIFL